MSTLIAPYNSIKLRCVEHHRVLRLVGYCPSCLLRRIDDIIRNNNYGLRTAESQLIEIRDIVNNLREQQINNITFQKELL